MNLYVLRCFSLRQIKKIVLPIKRAQNSVPFDCSHLTNILLFSLPATVHIFQQSIRSYGSIWHFDHWGSVFFILLTRIRLKKIIEFRSRNSVHTMDLIICWCRFNNQDFRKPSHKHQAMNKIFEAIGHLKRETNAHDWCISGNSDSNSRILCLISW